MDTHNKGVAHLCSLPKFLQYGWESVINEKKLEVKSHL